MTEEQLVEAVGWHSRCRRCEHIAETKRDPNAAVEAARMRANLRGLGIEIEARGWAPPAAIEEDTA